MANKRTTFRITEKKRRILVVEDEIINREMLRESLESTYDILIAQSGEEALEFVHNQHETISVVLLDLYLPGIGGIEVLKKIKDDPVYAHLPVSHCLCIEAGTLLLDRAERSAYCDCRKLSFCVFRYIHICG